MQTGTLPKNIDIQKKVIPTQIRKLPNLCPIPEAIVFPISRTIRDDSQIFACLENLLKNVVFVKLTDHPPTCEKSPLKGTEKTCC